jgi:hypothetical protein
VIVTQIPRTENEQADALARLGSTTDEKIAASKQQVVVLDNPFIAKSKSVMQIKDSYTIPEWARTVVEHLKDGNYPATRRKLKKFGCS